MIRSEANLEKARERTRKWRAANLEKARERDRRRYAAEPEKFREYERIRYAAEPEKFREQARSRRAAEPEKFREQARSRRAAEPEKFREKDREKFRKRRATEIGHLVQNIRSRIRMVLKGKTKSARSLELFGCDPEWFWNEYLPPLLAETKMTRENYGKVWHFDHIHALATFDLSDPDQQRKAFHWSNLRPLPAVKNLRKGAKAAPAKEVLDFHIRALDIGLPAGTVWG